MNPILHDLQNKQWVWTAANAKQQAASDTLATGYENLDKVLSRGFPAAGMIHIESPLGCGEMRLMLSVLQQQKRQDDKLYMFIDPPFELNAEFLLAQNIALTQLLVIHTNKAEDALWSAEQSAKSGACCAIFMWQKKLKHIQIRKLEHAALQGACYCVWLQSHLHARCANNNAHEQQSENQQSNLPLSLSLSIERKNDELSIKINKQKIGWAQKAVRIPLPFKSLTNRSLKRRRQHKVDNANKIVAINANR